jgi:7-cyano-7-deazaguanine synthase in queuosine biosynthesis
LPMFFAYGQPSQEAEQHVAERVCGILELQNLHSFKLDLGTIPELNIGDHWDTDRTAWVPGRNTAMMILAGIYCVTADADAISIGYTLDDNFVFGDNDMVHHKLIEATLCASMSRPVQVLLPLSSKPKSFAISMVDEANLLSLTVSCWNAELVNDDVVVCGACENCIERAESGMTWASNA